MHLRQGHDTAGRGAVGEDPGVLRGAQMRQLEPVGRFFLTSGTLAAIGSKLRLMCVSLGTPALDHPA